MLLDPGRSLMLGANWLSGLSVSFDSARGRESERLHVAHSTGST